MAANMCIKLAFYYAVGQTCPTCTDHFMKTPQAVITYILESFPCLSTPEFCSYPNYSMSYGTLNMVGGHLKNTNLMKIQH